MALTPKQQAYVAARISGSGPSEAYRTAYTADNMSPNAIAVEANRVEHSPNVSLVLNQAAERIQSKAEASAIDLLNRLWEIGSSDDKDRVPALSAMRSFYQEFRETAPVDARSLTLVLPEGTTLEDLKRLRAEIG